MKMIIDVIDFGDIEISVSPDNPECVRFLIPGNGLDYEYVDLLSNEVDSLIFALKTMRDRIA